METFGYLDPQNLPQNPNLPRSFWAGSLHYSLASHSTQGSHSKGLNHGFWGFTSRFNLKTAGLVIVAMFLLTWLGALLIWRYGRIEENGCPSPGARRLGPGAYPRL